MTCASRGRKERLEWGIPLPFDEGYVTYVWFDALLNYYSAVVDRPELWREVRHVIGKDILVPPHAVYWPIMLHAAGLPLPRGIIAHGWWLQRGAKMSKSTGNALNPLDLVDEFGADAFRYFPHPRDERGAGQRLHPRAVHRALQQRASEQPGQPRQPHAQHDDPFRRRRPAGGRRRGGTGEAPA
jgi:methionyl-tRNA synthetase